MFYRDESFCLTKKKKKFSILGISDFPQEHVWAAAEYLTAKAFLSLEHMFKSAKQIQDWFIQCATAISNQRDYVHWVSPLGLPILQPYSRKVSKEEINKGLSRK